MTSRFAGIERARSGEFDVARRKLVTTGDPYREGKFVGHWRVHRTLGRGGGGVVLEVSHRSSPTTRRALKIFRLPSPTDRVHWSTKDVERFERQFVREGELQMNVFKHPNILRVLDVGVTDNGAPYLVSDLLEGPTLEQVLHAARYGGPADLWARPPLCQPACVWRIGRDISLALNAVHRRGFVHRDVKPANLMLSRPTGDWVAVLTDFGTAVRAGVCDPSDWGIGTARYMAPELVSSGTPAAACRLVTTASDVYSFAIVLYELLTLVHPYAAPVKELLNGRDRSIVETAERRRVVTEMYRLAQRSSSATPARAYAPWLPQSVEQALIRALARDPALRALWSSLPTSPSFATSVAATTRCHSMGRRLSRRSMTTFRRTPPAPSSSSTGSTPSGPLLRPPRSRTPMSPPCGWSIELERRRQMFPK